MKHFTLVCIAVCVIIVSNIEAKSQQLQLFENYLFNKSVINPSHAGEKGIKELGVFYALYYRNVFDSSPNTLSAFADFNLSDKTGTALSIYQHNKGPEITTKFNADLAYHMKISSTWNLSAGLRLHAIHFNVNLKDLIIDDTDDPSFGNDIVETALNFGVGLVLQSEKSYIGLSIPYVLKNPIELYSEQELRYLADISTSYFLQAGTSLSFNQNWNILPSAVIHYNQSSQLKFNINTVIKYKDVVCLGPIIQLGTDKNPNYLDVAGFLIDIVLINRLQIGYVHEFFNGSYFNFQTNTYRQMLSLRYRL